MKNDFFRAASLRCWLLLAGLALVAPAAPAQAQCLARLYVNATVAAPGKGGSWASAYQSLGEALYQARQCGSTVQEIWVAQGTYRPTRDLTYNASPADPRDRTFRLLSGVAVYGGFAGTETTLTQRKSGHPTILSGDFSGDDVVSGSGPTLAIGGNAENAYHVLVAVGLAAPTVASTRLDGVSVRGGNASRGGGAVTVGGQPVYQDSGGGLADAASSPTLTNCTFMANSGNRGGGIFNDASSPVLTGCVFSANKGDGGGIANYTSSPTLSGCTLAGNFAATSGYGGGGMLNFNSSPALTNCVLVGNSAGNGGGLASYNASAPTLTNCTLTANTGSIEGGGFYFEASTGGTLTNCLLWQNTGNAAYRENLYKAGAGSLALAVRYCTVGDYLAAGTLYVTATSVSAADPLFANASDPDGPDNLPATADDGLALLAGSPARHASDPATTAPATDITGFARVGRFDQGAYAIAAAPLPARPATEFAARLALYPNPAHSELQLQLPAGTTATALRLYDAQGRLAASFAPATRLALPALAPGLYVLQATVAGQAVSARVAVE